MTQSRRLFRARNYFSIEHKPTADAVEPSCGERGPGTTKPEMINAVEQHVEEPATPAGAPYVLFALHNSKSLSGGSDA
jgi:hypothetical protein